MTNDNGMDSVLPISQEGVLAALDTAIGQAFSIHENISTALANSPVDSDNRNDCEMAITEIDAHIEYLRLLHDNIKEDRCNNYPPVVRKRFSNDGTII